MKKATGFITLHRQIQDWEWYRHPHTAFLFIHLLLSANYVDGMFQGRTIKRGQLVTSIPQLSTGTGLSIQQTKTAMAHLRLTGEITDEATTQYRIVTIVKYDQYQNLTGKTFNDQPTTNRQNLQRLTDESSNDQPQYNNITINNKEIKKQGNKERGTASRFTPPTRDDIVRFCDENGLTIDPDRFLYHYQSNGWMVGSNHMKNWQAAVRNWVQRDKKPENPKPAARTVTAQQFEQRDYSGTQEQIADDFASEVERRLRWKQGGGY